MIFMIANYNLPCIQTVLSNSQFRSVLDQPCDDVMLCKRRPEYSSSSDVRDDVTSSNLHRVNGSTKPSNKDGETYGRLTIRRIGSQSPNFSSISSKMQGSCTTRVAQHQTEEEKLQASKTLDYLIMNQFECQKELTKHFIYESFLNEKFNMNRFEFLPTACKNQVSIFLKECLGFDVQSETKTGSNRKYLFALKNRLADKESEEEKERKTMAFRAQCYIYGLRKQLHCEPTAEGNKQLVKTLFKVIHPESNDPILQEKFGEILFSLADATQNLDNQGTSEVLTAKLIGKIRQLPESILKKYYQITLSKYLTTLFDGCHTTHEMVDRLLPLNQTMDVYSNLQTESVPKSRTYQLAVLG